MPKIIEFILIHARLNGFEKDALLPPDVPDKSLPDGEQPLGQLPRFGPLQCREVAPEFVVLSKELVNELRCLDSISSRRKECALLHLEMAT